MSKDLIVGQNTTLLGITMIEIDTVQGPKSIWVPRDEVESYINVGAKRVNQNGTYIASNDSLDGYSSITVNVPPNVGTKTITKNGTYQASSDNIDGFSSVTVNVENNSNLGIKDINKNGTYTALSDSLDGYYQVKVAVKGTVLGGKEITANGSYNASDDNLDGYDEIEVDVPPNVGSKTITANGSYLSSEDDLDGYDEIEVNVPPNVGSKTITANGDYQASSDNYDGYSSVSVNVPPNVGTKTITENGTYSASSDDLDGYSTIEVNVAKGSDEGKEVIIVKEDGSIEFPSEEIGETLMLQDKTVTSNGVITPDTGYNGFRTVTVAVSGGGGDNSYIIVTDEDGNVVLPTVTLNRTVNLQEKTVTQNGLLTPDSGYDGFSSVEVNVSGGGGSGNVYTGRNAPNNAIGLDGDFYIQTWPDSILSSAGGATIDTGVTVNALYTAITDVRVDVAGSDYSTIFGCRSGSYARFTARFEQSSTGTLQYQKSTSPTASYSKYDSALRKNAMMDRFYKLELGAVIWEDDVPKSGISAYSIQAFPYSVYLFNNNDGGSIGADYGDFSMKRFVLLNQLGQVAQYLVPAEDNGEACMLDLVTGIYHKNISTGSFSFQALTDEIQRMLWRKIGGAWQAICELG